MKTLFSGIESDMKNVPHRHMKLWSSRLLIGIVLFFNIQCALVFLIAPENYLYGFNLMSIPAIGNIIIQGFGLLFIMWNVPYFFAFLSPIKYKISLLEAIIMQCIGFFGESTLLIFQPELPEILKHSIFRFMLFDGTGIILLIAAYYIARYVSIKAVKKV